jgi:F0F1-type ATP synthase membrane subunit c/vacuolar-type H+-ATPase subunit K
MKTKLSILAALVAVGAVGAGIGIAQGASSGNSTPQHLAVQPAVTPTHASAQVLFAVVGRMGQLNRGLGVASAGIDHGNTGEYHVLFKRGVAKCAYVATIGTTGWRDRRRRAVPAQGRRLYRDVRLERHPDVRALPSRRHLPAALSR